MPAFVLIIVLFKYLLYHSAELSTVTLAACTSPHSLKYPAALLNIRAVIGWDVERAWWAYNMLLRKGRWSNWCGLGGVNMTAWKIPRKEVIWLDFMWMKLQKQLKRKTLYVTLVNLVASRISWILRIWCFWSVWGLEGGHSHVRSFELPSNSRKTTSQNFTVLSTGCDLPVQRRREMKVRWNVCFFSRSAKWISLVLIFQGVRMCSVLCLKCSCLSRHLRACARS